MHKFKNQTLFIILALAAFTLLALAVISLSTPQQTSRTSTIQQPK